jgi:(p)ppGpp synthase/HD superfamily hydrolase
MGRRPAIHHRQRRGQSRAAAFRQEPFEGSKLTLVTNEHLTILRAAHQTAHWHAKQRRKGAGQEPYVNHLIEVADLVAQAGGSTDVIVAAFLHDAVEDQKISPETIAGMFGDAVAALVMEVTDDKNLEQDERKRLQVEHAPHLSPGAALIKLADKVSNVHSVTRSPPADWSADRRHEYVAWCGKVVARLPAVSPWLTDEFDRAVAEFKVMAAAGAHRATEGALA